VDKADCRSGTNFRRKVEHFFEAPSIRDAKKAIRVQNWFN